MLTFRSIFWVTLIKLASSLDEGAWVSTNTFCVQLNDDFLCPDNPPLFVRGKFKLLSGFAPYSVGDVKMKPKWSDEFQFPGDAKTVVFGPNYCFFTKETDRVRWLGCAQECFRGANGVRNPWYGHEFEGQRPNYGDPIAGQVNRYMAATTNTCPNPNTGISSQLNVGEYSASNYLQPSAGDNTGGDTAVDTTVAPVSSSDVFGVQANTQNQNHPDTLNQAYSGDNALRFKEANALLPSTADRGTDYLNLNQLGIGSGAGPSRITTSINGGPGADLGNGFGAIGTTVGTTVEDTSPKAFNFATLGNLPLFRKRDVTSARDFRL